MTPPSPQPGTDPDHLNAHYTSEHELSECHCRVLAHCSPEENSPQGLGDPLQFVEFCKLANKQRKQWKLKGRLKNSRAKATAKNTAPFSTLSSPNSVASVHDPAPFLAGVLGNPKAPALHWWLSMASPLHTAAHCPRDLQERLESTTPGSL